MSCELNAVIRKADRLEKKLVTLKSKHPIELEMNFFIYIEKAEGID